MFKGKPKELAKQLRDEKVFGDHKLSLDTLDEMDTLFEYLGQMNALDNILFDFSLARGLDYYTGLIYEAVLIGASVGSIAGGGRYDELVGMFSNKQIPAVGVSIGIERVFSILEEKEKQEKKIRASSAQILVASIGKGMAGHRLAICSELWEAGINAETPYGDNLRTDKVLSQAFDNGIPLVIWIGENELNEGGLKIKVSD